MKSLTISFVATSIVFGQTNPEKPLQQLQPPPLSALHENFTKAAQSLQPSKPGLATKKSKRLPSATITGTITPIIPERDIPLPQSALDALAVQGPWLSGSNTPVEGRNGRVLYTYGRGLPIIVASPLQLSVVELEPGEIVHIDSKGDPNIDLGDPIRWTVNPHTVGSGDKAQTYIVIKPQLSGLDTDLVVTTDRRAYYLKLMSKPHDYLAHVAFNYPEDDQKRKLREFAERQQAEAQKKAAEEALRRADTSGPCRNVEYDVKLRKHSDYLKPVSVCDDGAHTKIQLSEAARYRNHPSLTVTGPAGDDSPNWRFDPQALLFTVDGLFDQCKLVSGVGKHRLEVTITNKQKLVASAATPHGR